ncbi:unnamed protein product [Moneuplotes crassus]|uniref:Uncharacterized protein n=1 Tax=Euplotes crassus TaxID=5936 RepID=A0AAD1XWV9_EUPCR|nr:unnamed protein product [Moneuplotes crassus]
MKHKLRQDHKSLLKEFSTDMHPQLLKEIEDAKQYCSHLKTQAEEIKESSKNMEGKLANELEDLQEEYERLQKVNEKKDFEILEAEASARKVKRTHEQEIKDWKEKLETKQLAIESLQKAVQMKQRDLQKKKDKYELEIDKLKMYLPDSSD